jgi:hypothetical protein
MKKVVADPRKKGSGRHWKPFPEACKVLMEEFECLGEDNWGKHLRLGVRGKGDDDRIVVAKRVLKKGQIVAALVGEKRVVKVRESLCTTERGHVK